MHPRPDPLLYHETAARAETYLPARGGQAATGPGEMTDGRLTAERAVVVSAKGAARWQAGHPWIYRTDIYDEPRDAAGVVTVADRRGRPPGPAPYFPKSEIRLPPPTPCAQPHAP